MQRVLIFITAFLLSVAFPARSQTGVLKGKVFDQTTKDLIPFATVYLEDSNKTSQVKISDFDGKYRFTGISAGTFTVKCSYVGYRLWQNNAVTIRPGDTTILDIGLSASTQTLQEVQVVGYAIPRVTKSLAYSSMTVRGSRSSPPTPVNQFNTREYTEPGASGRLTASELNDFSKWDLWNDIKGKELKWFQKLWKIFPEDRYSVQVKNEDDRPVINATVILRNRHGAVLWATRTDNTGKAELWANLFGKQTVNNPEIVVSDGNKDYIYEKPNLFQKGINGLKIHVPCSVSGQVDIAFVVDATGSMEDEIGFLKSDVIGIIQKTKENLPELSVSLGTVFYRCFGNSYITKMHQMSADVTGAIDFIKAQNGGEGGAEAVEEALSVAVDSLDWNPLARARLLFLVLDEQPLTTPAIIQKMKYCVQKAAEKGIRIIPVVGSAETPSNASSMEYLLRSVALATNGTYVFLTDHSHIGDAHAKPVTDQYDVELLNTLLKRIIYQFSYAPPCAGDTVPPGIADTTTFSNSPVIAHEIIDTSRHIKVRKTGVIVKSYPPGATFDTIGRQSETDTMNTKTSADSIRPALVKKIEIKFYPNPTTGRIMVEIDGKINELFLTDFTGKLLSKINMAGVSKLEIDLGIYSTGTYFLKFQDNGKLFTGKIILIHR